MINVTLCPIIQKAEDYARKKCHGIWEEECEDEEEEQDEEESEPEEIEPLEEICSCSSNIYNCDDFSTHNEAQDCYEYCLSVKDYDIHWLDGDDDGLACEGLP